MLTFILPFPPFCYQHPISLREEKDRLNSLQESNPVYIHFLWSRGESNIVPLFRNRCAQVTVFHFSESEKRKSSFPIGSFRTVCMIEIYLGVPFPAKILKLLRNHRIGIHKSAFKTLLAKTEKSEKRFVRSACCNGISFHYQLIAHFPIFGKNQECDLLPLCDISFVLASKVTKIC
jgi:hypothetical protein